MLKMPHTPELKT